MNPDLRFDLFPTVALRSADSSITVPGERVCDGLFITAALDLGEGEYLLGGGFNVTHGPSGKATFPGQVCIECAREIGRRLAATGVDWTAIGTDDQKVFKASLGDKAEAVIAALSLFRKCAQQVCFHEDEECEACGFTRQHAPYCISVVGPMVAEMNARAGA
ncbi:MAG TPA: hypothetical protein VFY11_14810 [Nocardioidaceae bacterium]|nr:hypothetical protein [Nocardioidaceae bacterium]